MSYTKPDIHTTAELNTELVTADRIAECLARGRTERSLAFHACLAFVVAAVRRALPGRAADKQPNSMVTR
jgi:hypothetical protein